MTTPKIIATASVRRIQSRNDKERFMVENSFAAYLFAPVPVNHKWL
jgi:hypothetical protein